MYSILEDKKMQQIEARIVSLIKTESGIVKYFSKSFFSQSLIQILNIKLYSFPAVADVYTCQKF